MSKFRKILLIIMSVLASVTLASCSKQPVTGQEEVIESHEQAKETTEPRKAVGTNELYHIACESSVDIWGE